MVDKLNNNVMVDKYWQLVKDKPKGKWVICTIVVCPFLLMIQHDLIVQKQGRSLHNLFGNENLEIKDNPSTSIRFIKSSCKSNP